MRRNAYDFFGHEIKRLNKTTKVYYVECDCSHLAIRQKGINEIYRCSLCTKEYFKNKNGDIVLK